MTRSQAKKKCQRRPMARSCSAGRVAQDGNPRSSISPSGPREAPRNPVVSNGWPKMVVTPPTGSPLSSSVAENPRNGCSNWVACPQLSAGTGVEDLQPAHQEHQKAERIDPVTDPHDGLSAGRRCAGRRWAAALRSLRRWTPYDKSVGKSSLRLRTRRAKVSRGRRVGGNWRFLLGGDPSQTTVQGRAFRTTRPDNAVDALP